MKRIHKIYKLFSIFFLFFIFLLLPNLTANSATMNETSSSSISSSKNDQINSLVKKYMKKGKIPGVSIVIVSGDKKTFMQGFGYEDVTSKSPITSDTLFELGSNSKAFTALAVLKLENEGFIDLNDPVQKYIPWFNMKYNGTYKGERIDGNVTITIAQLLYHTSGIPFKSISDIPISSGDDALEKTVRTQVGKTLEFYPGEKFLYATINYDILGLVISNVSKISYEDYINKNIIVPLGLHNTYPYRNETVQQHISKGYKLRFLKAREYTAPLYRGNTPAGYIITDAIDLEKWLKIQLNLENIDSVYKDLVHTSHQPDRSVSPSYDGSSYAYGWSIYQDGPGIIAHKGSNPNFSSYIIVDPKENIGIGVMSNMNSSYTDAIAYGIHDIMIGNKPKDNTTDMYISIDNASTVIFIIVLLATIISLYQFIILIINIIKREQTFTGHVLNALLKFFCALLFIAVFGYCLYQIPSVLFSGVSWPFSIVWAPQSFVLAITLVFIEIVLFTLYFFISSIVTNKPNSSWFLIAILSSLSGFGNALLIFIINEVINRTDKFQSILFLYFVIAMLIYIFGQRLVRRMLLKLTNELVYNKRVFLIDKILSASYESIEQLESGKIHAGLNNDTEALSSFANVIITSVANMVTLLCCFVYLGILNKYALLISIIVVIVAGGIYYLVGRHANRIGEEARDIQNMFFKFINNLEYGFKELKMSLKKRNEFTQDMACSCGNYRDKRIMADLEFANVFVLGEMLFTMVIGIVAFIFPVFFEDIQTSSLRNYVFVYIYMTGPLRVILNSIPQIINVNICYKRIQNLALELDSHRANEKLTNIMEEMPHSIQLELSNIEYSYKNDNGEEFKIGPINYRLNSGEIIFITGGNGSGKSTLAKLLTGLYKPDGGKILLNNNEISSAELRQFFSTVFSDFHLFENLYGINGDNQTKKIAALLEILHLDTKVTYSNNKFSTLKLSSGQRRRLALLVSYLEDRPIYLFDEWASDQDPEFRKFFYENLLLELKKAGKCVIAITHDDRYFDKSDKIIKMELGQIIQ